MLNCFRIFAGSAKEIVTCSSPARALGLQTIVSSAPRDPVVLYKRNINYSTSLGEDQTRAYYEDLHRDSTRIMASLKSADLAASPEYQIPHVLTQSIFLSKHLVTE